MVSWQPIENPNKNQVSTPLRGTGGGRAGWQCAANPANMRVR
jgi:hypothetical protein